jgi:hypothetical protein
MISRELIEHGPTSLRIWRALLQQLRVAIVKVLRQFFDDLIDPARFDVQSG